MALVAAIAIGAGVAIDAVGKYKAGQQAKRIGEVNARAIETTSELNAQLVEEGSETNAQIAEFNARLAEAKARDAVYRGRETERRYRQQVRGLIGEQRTSYAGQNVDIGDGSALDVQMDTAYQGELDALTLRVNAQREAWGFTAEAANENIQAAAQRKLGRMQARGIRTSAKYAALSARMGGNQAAAAGTYGAAASVLTGGVQAYQIYRGFKGS